MILTKEAIYTSPFDACTNNENDQELLKLFALASVDAVAVHPESGEYSGHLAMVSYPDSEWIAIPPRERELNRIADTYDSWNASDQILLADYDITPQEFKERRVLRHPESDKPYQSWDEVPSALKTIVNRASEWHKGAEYVVLNATDNVLWIGNSVHKQAHKNAANYFDEHQFQCAKELMPVVNDTDVVETPESQSDQWMPKVGEEFETWVSNVGYWAKVTAKAHIDGGVLWRNGSDRQSYRVSMPDEIRPLKSEREVFIEVFEGIESNNCTSKPLSVQVYDWLIKQGVDLSVLEGE